MPFPAQTDVRPMHYAYVVRKAEVIPVTDLISSPYKVLTYYFKKNREME